MTTPNRDMSKDRSLEQLVRRAQHVMAQSDFATQTSRELIAQNRDLIDGCAARIQARGYL